MGCLLKVYLAFYSHQEKYHIPYNKWFAGHGTEAPSAVTSDGPTDKNKDHGLSWFWLVRASLIISL